MTLAPPIRFAIPDLQTGCDIIARLPLATPGQACADLQGILDSLLAMPPAAETYFRLLEQARVAASFLAEELAKRYQNKPIPLGDVEDGVFESITSTWQKFAKAYAHCAQIGSPDGVAADATRVATLLQRCIHYTGMVIIEHQHARREYPWGCWLDLHGYYASAEEWGLATHSILDPLASPGRPTHCTATYVAILLSDMAGSYSLTVKEQQLVRRWALLWAPLVKIYPAGPEHPPTRFVFDLMQDYALRPLSQFTPGPNLRALDTSRLAKQLGQLREQLRQRVSPTQLGLGDDCSAAQCAKLLGTLVRPWAQAPAIRKFRRHAGTGTVELCAGFEEMHYFIAGRVFEQPENVRTYSRVEFESMFAFRHQVDPQQALQIQREQLDFHLDHWEIVNQSAQGFRLARSVSGRRMVHAQLIALRPPGGSQFFLARSSWLMQERENGLIGGIHALPGVPQPIAARPRESEGEGGLHAKYHPIFLLPIVASISTEQTLILPLGWHRYGSVLDLYTDRPWQVRLLHVVDDGSDFERVSFTLC